MRYKFAKTSWLRSHINDPYVKRAKCEGYRARSAYKLKEIDERDDLLRNASTVIDLGAAPGSWSQYVISRLKKSHLSTTVKEPLVIAVDLLTMDPIPGVLFIQGDFQDNLVVEKILANLKNRKVDLVISDMAPNLSGVYTTDAVRVSNLSEAALNFSKQVLQKNGSLLIKGFYGNGYDDVLSEYQKVFQTVVIRKPKASRNRSAEVFLLGKKFL